MLVYGLLKLQNSKKDAKMAISIWLNFEIINKKLDLPLLQVQCDHIQS